MRRRPPEGATGRARALRSNATDAERALWRLLRECFPEARFRRQVPIADRYADFASHRLRLVVEADGGQHDVEVDAARTAALVAQGYRVVRFWNNDILGNADGVVIRLSEVVSEQNRKLNTSGNATPTQPSPIKGEG